MLKQPLIAIFERDLNKLIEEINAYNQEQNLWKTEASITNSAGNLCLHLIGNLNHFIGAVLGNSGYVRERNKEFSDKNIPREKIIAHIHEVNMLVKKVLSDATEETLSAPFPEKKQGQDYPTNFILIHLLAHLEYHLGQINYHRRLLDK